MALLTVNEANVIWAEGEASRTALIALHNVNAGDTVDIGSSGGISQASSRFSVVKRGGLVSVTGTTIAAVTFTGTVITIPSGPANDGVYLLIYGVGSD